MQRRPLSDPLIQLYSLGQAAVIICYRTGVVYQTQTCGAACVQRQVEGALVPLLDIPLDINICPLYRDLARLDWWPIIGITVERADLIDALLRCYPATQGIWVDRSRLPESEEAWIYVTVAPHDGAEYQSFPQSLGILTWPNSD